MEDTAQALAVEGPGRSRRAGHGEERHVSQRERGVQLHTWHRRSSMEGSGQARVQWACAGYVMVVTRMHVGWWTGARDDRPWRWAVREPSRNDMHTATDLLCTHTHTMYTHTYTTHTHAHTHTHTHTYITQGRIIQGCIALFLYVFFFFFSAMLLLGARRARASGRRITGRRFGIVISCSHNNNMDGIMCGLEPGTPVTCQGRHMRGSCCLCASRQGWQH